jgi:vacuolar-type H+-ATPase subunit C/Vma6
MNNVSKYAFIHAKTHGLMAKTWLDERLRFLVKITSLLDLSKTLFPEQAPAAGEAELVSGVQRKFETSVIETLVRLASLFPEPPEILVHVLREYDYRNLLALFREKFSGLTTIRLWDIGRYSLFKGGVEGFPQSLRKTVFEKFIPLMENSSLSAIEFQLARQYYEGLLARVHNLPAKEKTLILPLVRTEVLLQNLVWALRLRFYFSLGFDEAEKLLFPLSFAGVIQRARLVFELSPDDPEAWRKLGFGGIFSARRDGHVDPPGVESLAHRYVYGKLRRLFYAHPFTLASLYAFFRIKKYEARLVTSVSEGIRMGLDFREITEAAGSLK